MRPFTFIHAADLHLGAPLPGSLLPDAPFLALERLIDFTLRSRAAFLLLAGDIYNAEEPDVAGRLKLRDALARLGDIPVFWAHGNHDPGRFGPAKAYDMNWPDNVRFFGPELESFSVPDLAIIHGISFREAREERPLAKLFKRTEDSARWQIGLLHCSLEGRSEGHASYAPCTQGDLRAARLDYWALGHVHAADILDDPLAAYPGSLQGLHINETGAHGCLAVSVDERGRAVVRRQSLAPLRWEKLSLELDADLRELDALQGCILRMMQERAAALRQEEKDYPCLGLECRLEITGRGPLDRILRKERGLEHLVGDLNRRLAGRSDPALRLRDVVLRSAPDIDLEAVRRRGDLLAECFKVAEEFKDELPGGLPPDLLAAVAALYTPKNERWLPGLGGCDFRPEDWSDALAAASLRCLDLLSAELPAPDGEYVD